MSTVEVARPASRPTLCAAGASEPVLRRHVLREPATAIATVLLVEDDGHCRAGLRRHLVRAGFDVLEAANGLEALHLLRRRKVDVLATDIRMPTMSGIALVDALTLDHLDLPVIAYSGALLVDPEIRDRLRARHVPFLLKQFPPEVLVGALHAALNRTGPTS